MDLDLEQRLLRFLAREEDGERRTLEEVRALSVEDRVLEGECIAARLVAVAADGALTLEAEENLSRFREGDPVLLGDGSDFGAGVSCVYRGFDPGSGRVLLAPDAFATLDTRGLRLGERYCVDRRSLDLRDRLSGVVRDAFARPALRAVLLGEAAMAVDPERAARARERLGARGLNPAQVEGGALAIGAENLALVQGPPGTGKTAVLAEVVAALAGAGCCVALAAFTHRAVDNALFAIRRVAPDLPLCKLGHGHRIEPELRGAGIRTVRPRGDQLPRRGAVVGGTCHAFAKLNPEERFHYVVFDEAGQIPIPHALAGMLQARRWLFFGDHAQLPPVITARHADPEVTRSVFERLHAVHGSHLLDLSYRMNDALCAVVGGAFYGGRLRAAPAAAGRRMPFVPGGRCDDVLDPARPAVLARVDHLQPGQRSQEEANLVADLVDEIVRRHGVPPEEVAVVAPFRAQVRLVRSALDAAGFAGRERVVVDTVERMQGQEREVVLVSLAAGDPDSLHRRAAFFYSTNRLNVSLSRARTKAILVASRGAFAGLPMEAESLRAAATFRRLYRMLPQVDLTAVYGPA
ncbi:MAG: ATP-binding protein [Planctomycetes bacterium]|nr:ATP-binding protein [Planctomycetota bacterium]